VSAWDQQGCFSPQEILLRQVRSKPVEFAKELSEEMEITQKLFKRNSIWKMQVLEMVTIIFKQEIWGTS